MIRAIESKLSALPLRKICEWSVLGFLAAALLLKGGKGLEATWMLVLLAWMCTYFHWFEKPKQDTVPVPLWLGVLLFAVLTLVSYLYSSTQNYGLDEVLRTGALSLLFLWVVRTGGRKLKKTEQSFLDMLCVTVVVATVVAGAIGVSVYVFQPVNRLVGTFFDYRFHTDYWPNAWAQYLLLAWPLAALWAAKEQRFVYSVLRFLVVGAVWGFLALSYSRGAVIAFAGQLVLWGAIAFSGKGAAIAWKEMLLKTVAVVCMMLAIFFGANRLRAEFYAVQSVEEKVTFTASEGASSVSERRQFWGQAWTLSLEKPLLGWGPYSFRFIQPRLQSDVLATSDHPHNVFLKYAMERGWIVALIFLALVATVLFKAAWLDVVENKKHRSSFLLLSVAGLLAHSLIDFNLQFVSVSLLFWILLGLLVAAVPWGKGKKLNTNFVRAFEIIFATFLLTVAIVEARDLLTSSFGRHAEARGENAAALQWYDAAKNQRFSRDLHLSRTKILYEQKRFIEAQEALDLYFDQNAQDARAWKRAGDIARSERDPERALAAYEQAWERGRYNDFSIVRAAARTMIDAGMREELMERKEEIVTLMTHYVDAIERNVHFVALSPNVEEVVMLSETFENVYPREAPLFQVLSARADHYSKLERERIKARPPGYLW